MKRFASAFALFVTALVCLAISIVFKFTNCFGLESVYVITVGIDLALIAICINFFLGLARGVFILHEARMFWMVTFVVEMALMVAGMIFAYMTPPMHPQVLIPFAIGFALSSLIGWFADRSRKTS